MPSAGSKQRPFQRLTGLETEYIIRYQSEHDGAWRASNAALCDAVTDYVSRRGAVARNIVQELGWFGVNGGAFRFEHIPILDLLVPTAGMLEGATPECRGPRQLLQYQRAQDVLLSQAMANSAGTGGEASLVKVSYDSRQTAVGTHENYEATLAGGVGLFFWKIFLVLFLLVALPISIFVVFLLLFVAVARAAVLLAGGLLGLRERAARAWEIATMWTISIALFPVLLIPNLFLKLVAFRKYRRLMTAFLISRPVFSGAGGISSDGVFRLSLRARALGAVTSVASEVARPLFYFGHFLKSPMAALSGDVWTFGRLFGPRQRMQITCGESNMAQTSEFLKIGTTLLVLDAVEAGFLDDAPRVWFPLRAFRKICNDASLQATVRLNRGRKWTAIQIQRYYHEACARYLASLDEPHAEAEEVLRIWGEVLDALETDPTQLVGRVDWVTKRYLMTADGKDLPLDARRKIDLRYHELSKEGYYLQLESAGAAPTLIEPEDVVKAMQWPPEGTPAELRGRLIRENSRGRGSVLASWSVVRIPKAMGWKTVRLDQPDPENSEVESSP